MKSFLAFFLALTLLTDTGIKLGFLAKYCYSLDIYITKLCEKKDIEDNTCNGFCKLSQEISDASPSDQSTTASLQIEESQPLLNCYFTDFQSKIFSRPVKFLQIALGLTAPYHSLDDPPPKSMFIA